MNIFDKNADAAASDAQLLADEARYSSFGDTVHYVDPPKIFQRGEGSYMFDGAGVPYLDLQMWYSACNFGYSNKRLNDALKDQIDTLPQVASQYLHPTRVQLAKTIAVDMHEKFGLDGRVHFNVGGAQAIEDSLKIVRNARGGKSLMFAFEGGYHGRTLGASSITSSYRYRRRYGHFGERAMFIPFPYLPSPEGHDPGRVFRPLRVAVRAPVRKRVQRRVGSQGRPGRVRRVLRRADPGHRRRVIPPRNFFTGLKRVLDKYGILMVVDEIQMGFWRTGKLWSIEHFGVTPDVLVFGKALTNGLNPLSGLWAREELINPTVFPPGSTHSTFNSNPLGTRLGLEVLKLGKEMDYERTVPEKGAYFLDGLRGLQKRRRRRRPGPGPARRDLPGRRLHPEQGTAGPHGRHRPGR